MSKASTNEIMVAIGNVVGQDYVIKKGDRLRADNPLVQAHAEFFAPDGQSDQEMALQLAQLNYTEGT